MRTRESGLLSTPKPPIFGLFGVFLLDFYWFSLLGLDFGSKTRFLQNQAQQPPPQLFLEGKTKKFVPNIFLNAPDTSKNA